MPSSSLGVRFDRNALSPNIQISRSCSNWLCLNLPREFRYCNGSEFEFPSWVNKSLFGSKATVSRYPFMAIFETLNKGHCLWIWSASSWYVFRNTSSWRIASIQLKQVVLEWVEFVLTLTLPNISIHVLLTFLYTYLLVLRRRICSTIKNS